MSSGDNGGKRNDPFPIYIELVAEGRNGALDAVQGV